MAQLAHGPGFDLTNSFARQIEGFSDLFKCAGFTAIESEAQRQNLTFALIKRCKKP